MPVPPSHLPAESFATILRWLVQAVVLRGAGDRLAAPLIALILGRLRDINQRFARLAARLRQGTFRPRRAAARRKPVPRKPRRKNPLPQTFGWLLTLVPEAVGYRAQLEHLLRDPEMTALIAAAPAPMARALRPLLWMLRLTPPPILPPRQGTIAARPKAPRPSPPRPSPPSSPRPARVPARACGPPYRA